MSRTASKFFNTDSHIRSMHAHLNVLNLENIRLGKIYDNTLADANYRREAFISEYSPILETQLVTISKDSDKLNKELGSVVDKMIDSAIFGNQLHKGSLTPIVTCTLSGLVCGGISATYMYASAYDDVVSEAAENNVILDGGAAITAAMARLGGGSKADGGKGMDGGRNLLIGTVVGTVVIGVVAGVAYTCMRNKKAAEQYEVKINKALSVKAELEKKTNNLTTFIDNKIGRATGLIEREFVLRSTTEQATKFLEAYTDLVNTDLAAL